MLDFKKYIVIFLLIISFKAYSEESRFFQFMGGENDNSYISLDAGTFSGINIISKRIQLSFLYSFLFTEGFNVSTDLFMFNGKLNSLSSIKVGFGGGIIFQSEINSFSSIGMLRFPIVLEYNNLYLSTVPMFGTTMFEYETTWKYNISVSVGYKFKVSK